MRSEVMKLYDHIERYDARLLTLGMFHIAYTIVEVRAHSMLVGHVFCREQNGVVSIKLFVCCQCSSFEPSFADCLFCRSFCRSFCGLFAILSCWALMQQRRTTVKRSYTDTTTVYTPVSSLNLAVRHDRNRLFMFILSEPALLQP